MTSLTALTSLRLRRTFRYPEESDNDDGTREELDEEEQDAIVQDLRQRDEQGNAQYKLLLSYHSSQQELFFHSSDRRALQRLKSYSASSAFHLYYLQAT